MSGVDLAREADFQLGALRVRPSLRQVEQAGRAETLQPRIMQVLVLLARRSGEVVSRTELFEQCWDGRIVGEDALHRCVSKVRQLGDSSGGFQIETIPRVGYRLTTASGANDGALLTAAAALDGGAPDRSRRRLLLAGGAVATIALGGATYLLTRPPPPPSRAMALYRRAVEVGATDDARDAAQAVSFLRETVALAPDFADAWAALALAYVYSFDTAPLDRHPDLAERAWDAASRALELDPDNADARAAHALSPPIYRRWTKSEAALRAARTLDTRLAPVDRAIANLLTATGQARASLPFAEQAVAREPLMARRQFELAMALWHAGRIEDAERTIEGAFDLWPLDVSVWFGRLYLWMHGGQPRRAMAQIEDVAGRPRGIPATDFELVAAVLRAMVSGDAADVRAAIDMNLAAARQGLGYASNTAVFAATLGDADAAFAAANAYFFDTPFSVAQTYFTPQQGEYRGVRSRETMFLFGPPLETLREDARFAALVEAVGLEAYWREAGVTPDYRAPGMRG